MKTVVAAFLFAVVVLISISQSESFASGPAAALPPAKCQKDFNSFEAWREDFRLEATRKGISTATWREALPQITVDSEILRRDRSQGAFYVDFLTYSVPRAHPRIQRARNILKQRAALFQSIEKQYGIATEVIVAFWGLESDFRSGRINPTFPIITSMATLAYDCRRSANFRDNLMSALKLIENGDLTVEELEGQWAGEMSGLQLTPSNYFNFGTDFDKDGKRDIVNSVPDMMASAASMFKSYGWVKGQPYILEVKVPAQLPWQNADLAMQRMFPVAAWSRVGVTKVDGSPLPALPLNASLMLPMGRLGPAFLAFPNFKTLLQWNASISNALTAAYLASRAKDPSLPPMRTGNGEPEIMTSKELKELQTLLSKQGYNMGKIDGYIGTQTRIATRDMQLKLKLPADSYPTRELLAKVRQLPVK